MTRSSSLSKIKASIRRTSANIVQKLKSGDTETMLRDGLESLASRMKRTRSMSIINQKPENNLDQEEIASRIKMSISSQQLTVPLDVSSPSHNNHLESP